MKLNRERTNSTLCVPSGSLMSQWATRSTLPVLLTGVLSSVLFDMLLRSNLHVSKWAKPKCSISARTRNFCSQLRDSIDFLITAAGQVSMITPGAQSAEFETIATLGRQSIATTLRQSKRKKDRSTVHWEKRRPSVQCVIRLLRQLGQRTNITGSQYHFSCLRNYGHWTKGGSKNSCCKSANCMSTRRSSLHCSLLGHELPREKQNTIATSLKKTQPHGQQVGASKRHHRQLITKHLFLLHVSRDCNCCWAET